MAEQRSATVSASGVPIVVTRPDLAGRELAAQLAQHGADALWLPSFVIGPAPDLEVARAQLRQLRAYDIAVFVSPNAVRATRVALASAESGPASKIESEFEYAWPAQVVIGAVGAATQAQAAAAFAGAKIIAPALLHDDDDAGSEALWRALQSSSIALRRVLILRAEAGREWLREQFQSAGAEVTSVAVYSRRVPPLNDGQRRWLHERSGGAPPALVVTSSEAVAALAQQMDAAPTLARWLRTGRAFASHPRIAARLQAAGYLNVAVVMPQAQAIVAALAA